MVFCNKRGKFQKNSPTAIGLGYGKYHTSMPRASISESAVAFGMLVAHRSVCGNNEIDWSPLKRYWFVARLKQDLAEICIRSCQWCFEASVVCRRI